MLVLFDPPHRPHLLPLAFTRPVAEFRIGILTIREKWERLLEQDAAYLTQPYLQGKYPPPPAGAGLWINGALCPDEATVIAIRNLAPGDSLWQDGHLLVAHTEVSDPAEWLEGRYPAFRTKHTIKQPALVIERPWQIFQHNGTQLRFDLQHVLKLVPNPEALSRTNTLLGTDIYIAEGARAEAATFNTTTGPVYLGPGSEVMEGSLVRGPLALGESSALKLGAKIYGPTTIGPHCKVGGEVNNTVLFGYSNKAHDGFLGNAVLGEWCNIGADSNNSNLKNNYTEVRMWDYVSGRFEPTGMQFCGLIMGDHSKCGINTMFNTGTVVGVSANLFGAGFPRNFVPDFSWGGAARMQTYQVEKALEVAEVVMARRDVPLTDADRDILREVFRMTEEWRRF